MTTRGEQCASTSKLGDCSSPVTLSANPCQSKLASSASWLLLCFCFLIPLKLSLAYCALYPYLIISLATNWRAIKEIASSKDPIIASFRVFLLVALVSSLLGIDPIHSVLNLPSVLIYSLLAPVVAAQLSCSSSKEIIERSVWALLCGQTIAATHSVFNSSLNDGLPKFLIGSVTESGQLTLVIPFALGILVMLVARNGNFSRASLLQQTAVGLSITAVTIVIGFAPLQYQWIAPTCLASLYLCLIIWLRLPQIQRDSLTKAVLWIILPLLIGALFVNLKRGPWLGVACGIGIFVLFANRRLLFPFMAAGLATVTLIPQVRTRLISSAQDFFMSGGRGDIWQIGVELIQRFPLGIGYKNSSFLRKFNSEIPPELKHFHNNFLNILVETGWLGLLAYLVFLAFVIRRAFANNPPHVRTISVAIGAAIVSWQVAGIVEYSFGDSEVVLISYLLIGILLGLKHYGFHLESDNATLR